MALVTFSSPPHRDKTVCAVAGSQWRPGSQRIVRDEGILVAHPGK